MALTDRPKTPFMRYLDRVGDDAAAERLGVAKRTVQSWRLGERAPRPVQAQQITSKMPVTMDDIYRPDEQGAAA